MLRPNVSYDIRFDGVAFQVVRTRTYLTIPPTVEVYGPFATREQAAEEIRIQEMNDSDKARDRAGR